MTAEDSKKEALLVLMAMLQGSLPNGLGSDTGWHRRKVIWGLPSVKQGCFSRLWQSLKQSPSFPGYLQLCDPLS